MNGASLTIIKNPFRPRDRQIRQILPGQTVAESLAKYGITNPGEELCVSVNGTRTIDLSVVTKDGDWITVVPKVESSGNGKKNILGVIAGLALTVVSMGVSSVLSNGAFWVGAKGFVTAAAFSGAWFAGMAVMAIGGMLIAAMTPQPSLDIGTLGDYSSSQTYGWNKPQALQGQGHAVAETFGTIKTCGQLLAGHVVTDGDNQYLYLLYSGGAGPVDFVSEITIDGNPVGNYADAVVETRLGTNDQSIIPGFVETWADQNMSYELGDAWTTHVTEGSDGQAVEITIEFPNGLYHLNDSGNTEDTNVVIDAEYRKEGETSWRPWGQWMITAASTSAVRRLYRLDIDEAGRWEVRVKRTSAEGGGSSRYVNRVYWTQLTHILYDDFTLPGLVLIGIKALATNQLSNTMPEVRWKQGRINGHIYNPNTAAYEVQRLDNPAWASYDILHNARKIRSVKSGNDVVIVKGFAATRMNYDSFAAWATRCTANNLTFNHYYEQASDIWGALKYPETVGHGKVIIEGTTYTPIWDDVVDSWTQLFTVGNIKAGTFNIKGLPKRDQANSIEVTFFDKEQDCQRRPIVVYGPKYNASKHASGNPAQIVLYGCDNYTQAYKDGWYRLKLQNIKRTASWEAGVDSIACRVGDVVGVQHDIPQWGYGGRILSATSDTVTLDRTVTMSPDKTYEVMIRFNNLVDETGDEPTDYLETKTVAAVAETTETNVLTLTEPFTFLPQKYDVYSFGQENLVVKPFRVLRITRTTDQERKLTGIEYIPAVYTDDAEVPVVEYSDLVLSAAVTNLQAVQTNSSDGIRITASWYPPRSLYAGALVTCNGKQVARVGASESKASFVVESGGTYRISVSALDMLGRTMPATYLDYDTTLALPSDVETLTAETMPGGSIRLYWPLVTGASGYRLRLQSGVRPFWQSGQNLHSGIITATAFETSAVAPGQYVVMIKAVDPRGNESANPAYVIFGLGDEEVENILIETDIVADGFSGTLTNCSVVDGVLVADDTGGSFWPEGEYSPFYDGDSDPFYRTLYKPMSYVQYVSLDDGNLMLQATTKGLTQLSYAAGNPFWPADDAQMFWGNDTDAFWPSEDLIWIPYSSKVIANNDGCYVKVDIDGGQTRGEISRLKAIVDVPDIIETINDVSISAAGTALPITKTYDVITNVTITVQDDGGSAISARIVNRDKSGPVVMTLDASGAATAGTVDAKISGYRRN